MVQRCSLLFDKTINLKIINSKYQKRNMLSRQNRNTYTWLTVYYYCFIFLKHFPKRMHVQLVRTTIASGLNNRLSIVLQCQCVYIYLCILSGKHTTICLLVSINNYVIIREDRFRHIVRVCICKLTIKTKNCLWIFR